MKYTEAKDKELDAHAITETLAQLTTVVSTLSDAVVVLMHKLDVEKDMPAWKTKEEIEKEVGPKIKACIDIVRRVDGPSETNKN